MLKSICSYANDTELHCCGEILQNVQNNFQSDLQGWLQANKLQLNVSKSVIMLLGSWQKFPNHSVALFINGIEIPADI